MDNSLLKKAFLEAYQSTYGNITKSCKAVDISRQTFYNWKEDEDFLSKLNEIEPEEEFLDLVEDKLIDKVKSGDITALIFIAKTKGKKRGYIERSELDMSGQVGVNINQIVDDGCEPLP